MQRSKVSPLAVLLGVVMMSLGSVLSAPHRAMAEDSPPVTPQGIYDSTCQGQGATHSVRLYAASDGTLRGARHHGWLAPILGRPSI